jgi:hypothetical protein
LPTNKPRPYPHAGSEGGGIAGVLPSGSPESSSLPTPAISLPKGGGAIRAEPDVFILSGAEDLVRALVQVGGQWWSDEPCIAFGLVRVEREYPYLVDWN